MRTRVSSLLIVPILLAVFQAPALGVSFANPAEPAFGKTHFELVLPEIGFGLSNNLLNLASLNADLTDPAAKEEFLGRMEGGVYKLNTEAHVEAGLTIGRLGLHLRPWGSGTSYLAPGIPEVIFEGIDINRLYELQGSKINSMAALAADLSYARPFKLTKSSSLGIGVDFHYLMGLGLLDLVVSDGELSVDEYGNMTYSTDVATHYVYIPVGEGFSPEDFQFVGQGYLVDVGLIYQREKTKLGLAVKNIGPGITWTGVTSQTATVSGEITAGPNGPQAPEPDYQLTDPEITTYTPSIPMVVQASLSYQVFKGFTLDGGVSVGLADGWGVSSTPSYWAGFEWIPLGVIRLGGTVALQGTQLDYRALAELRLLCLWLTAEAGMTGGFLEEATGAYGALGLRLHF